MLFAIEMTSEGGSGAGERGRTLMRGTHCKACREWRGIRRKKTNGMYYCISEGVEDCPAAVL